MRKEKEYPLYPELSKEGEEEAQKIMDSFKEKIKTVIDEVLTTLYCDVATYIESDSWQNFRNQLMDGLRNYDNRKVQGQYVFKQIRQSILKNHREDIINDLNQDMIEEIKTLKESIERLHE